MRKFVLFLSLSCVAGLAVASLATWSLDAMLPVGVARYHEQLINYGNGGPQEMMVDVKMNHTLIVSPEAPAVESIVQVSRWYDNIPDIEITIRLGDYCMSGQIEGENYTWIKLGSFLSPKVTEGSLKWTGKIYVDQTVILCNTFEFETDGIYYISALAMAHRLGSGWEGATSHYFIEVHNGMIERFLSLDEAETTSYWGP